MRSRGLKPALGSAIADLEVIHTCTVTHVAAAKSRQAIRRAARRAGHADRPKVVVTGCYAGSNADEALSLVGHPDQVVPQGAADGSTLGERFAERMDSWLIRRPTPRSVRNAGWECSNRRTTAQLTPATRVLPLPVMGPEGATAASRHIRAELRIQDGCDAHCTFCIIPQIRPVLRSKRVADAREEARRLVELGHREIVLTGIFIGAYGHETALRRRQRDPGGHPLAELVDTVAQVPGLARLRISSVEPGDVTEALLDAMIEHAPVVVPHLHVPLQSGSDRILRRMNRQYGTTAYLEMIDQVQRALTIEGLGPALTTDILCGFPGETAQDFQQTLAVAQRVGYLHMHVFPYSRRAGTAAARWTDQAVQPATIRQRVNALIDLEQDPHDGLSIRYRRHLLGRLARVILERPDPDRQGAMLGRCDHYAQLSVTTEHPRGTVMQVRITDVTPTTTLAHPAEPCVSLPQLQEQS